jgi:hypothetical protein
MRIQTATTCRLAYRKNSLERPVFVYLGVILESHIQLDERRHRLFRQPDIRDVLARGRRRGRDGRFGARHERRVDVAPREECERAKFRKVAHDQRWYAGLGEVDGLDNVDDGRLRYPMNTTQ